MAQGPRGRGFRSLIARFVAVAGLVVLMVAATLAAVLGAAASLADDLLFIPVVVGSFSITLFLVLFWRGDGIEEVFLIHRSGLLLTHFSRTLKPERDRDMLVAMLTALQSFVQETFASGPAWGLREMDFGEGRMILCRGGLSSLAVLVHGTAPRGLSRRVTRTLESVEERFGQAILNWDGLSEELAGADELIEKALFAGTLKPIWARFRAAISRVANIWRPAKVQEAELVDQVRVQVSNAGSQESASTLLQRAELWSVKRQYRPLMVTALQQIEEGAFSLPALANIYMTIAMQRDPGPRSRDWWDLVMRTVRDVLRSWPWDPSSQSWVAVSSRQPSPSRPASRIDLSVVTSSRSRPE